MARKPRAGTWSMKTDRELIGLAQSETLEAIVDQLQRRPATILKKAARLGLSVKRKAKGDEAGAQKNQLRALMTTPSDTNMPPVKSELIGARFKMSPLGSARCSFLAGKEGIIIGSSRYAKSVRVRFDGNKSPTSLHRDYIELVPPEPER
jgi:hypothetical protein